jgi:hypothetical protein
VTRAAGPSQFVALLGMDERGFPREFCFLVGASAAPSLTQKFVTAAPLSRYAGKMDINKMLADLRTERDQISEAIVVLERLTIGQGKRRGRPPKWLTEVKRRGRPKGSKNKPKEE